MTRKIDGTPHHEPEATLHPLGSLEYYQHVANEQEAMRQHTREMAGRELTDDEASQLDEAVEQAIARSSLG